MTTRIRNSMDRRPIAARSHPLAQRATHILVRLRVLPDAISVLGMLCALGASASLVATDRVSPSAAWAYWLVAGLLIGLRLLANMLDGMVAIESGRTTAVGYLFNEIPDRVSDVAVLVGVGYAVGANAPLGYLAALAALFAAYVRSFGNACGVSGLFHGPMDKTMRMYFMICLCLYMGLSPASWQPQLPATGMGIPALVLALIGLGTLLTSVQRIRVIATVLRRNEGR